MGNIILPPSKYHFMVPESRELDFLVDQQTRAFDSDESLRDIVAEQFFIETPANWMEVGSPVFHARLTQKMIVLVRYMRGQLGEYRLPTIVVPGDMPEYRKRIDLQQEWHADDEVRGQVEAYEAALADAYFEFCKQTMNNLLEHVAADPLPKDMGARGRALYAELRKFKPEVFRDCDNTYYNAACRLLREAGKKLEPLKESNLGRFFVLSDKEIKEMMSQ